MIDGAVSASATAISYVNDLSASAQAQLNALRDGTATAKNALVATTAATATNATNLGGTAAAGYPKLASVNTFTAGQKIRATIPYLWLETSAQGTDANVWLLGYVTGTTFGMFAEKDDGTSGTAFFTAHRKAAPSATSVDAIDFTADLVRVNGQNVLNPVQLSGIPAASYARLDQAQTFNGGQGSTIVAVNTAVNPITINCALGDVHRLDLTGSRTLAAPASPRSGQTLVLILRQLGTGSNLITWNSVFKFSGGTKPTLSTAVNSVDVFAFVYDNLYSVWLQAGLNVS